MLVRAICTQTAQCINKASCQDTTQQRASRHAQNREAAQRAERARRKRREQIAVQLTACERRPHSSDTLQLHCTADGSGINSRHSQDKQHCCRAEQSRRQRRQQVVIEVPSVRGHAATHSHERLERPASASGDSAESALLSRNLRRHAGHTRLTATSAVTAWPSRRAPATSGRSLSDAFRK